MNLVIPYRHDKYGGAEIRYCIRSMVMYFKDLTGVVVIGDRPEWYKGEHIPAKDTKGQKEKSIIDKLLLASGTILFSSDDIFALKPFDAELPQYYFRTCRQKMIRALDSKYKKLYKACPERWLNFDIHAPMVIDTDKYRSLDDMVLPVKTKYANNFPNNITEAQDFKIKGPQSYANLKAFINRKMFFSTDTVNEPLIKILNELYPLPSQYE